MDSNHVFKLERTFNETLTLLQESKVKEKDLTNELLVFLSSSTCNSFYFKEISDNLLNAYRTRESLESIKDNISSILIEIEIQQKMHEELCV